MGSDPGDDPTQGVESTYHRGLTPITTVIFADSLSSEQVTPSGNPRAGYSASYQVAFLYRLDRS